MPDVIAGFDIGGTKVSLVVADPTGEREHHVVEPTETASELIEYEKAHSTYFGLSVQLREMLTRALAELGKPRVQAIGIVSAGPIHDGALRSPPNVVPQRLRETHRDLPRLIPVVEPLRHAFACPVSLLNDCNGGVLGEVYYGLGRDVQDKSTLHLAYVTISTGFGAGAWDGGRLVLGKHGNAGEVGHSMARENGLPCGCGNRGCVESYASGAGIVRNASTRLLSADPAQAAASKLTKLLGDAPGDLAAPSDIERIAARVVPEVVFEAAAEEDPIASCVVEDVIAAAGTGLAVVANAYDPAIISVGGGIALAHPELLDPIREAMLQHIGVAAPEVRLTPLGAGVTEAGALASAQEIARTEREATP